MPVGQEPAAMKLLHSLWHEEEGVLSFEWTLLLTLLTIGIVSGLTAARDAIIDELGDVAEAAQAFDQSYTLAAIVVMIDTDGDGIDDTTIFETSASSFLETAEDRVYSDCTRTEFLGQVPQHVTDDPS